ncbi:MAG: NAD(+) synthase, partial [Paludibacter sp.]
MSENNYGFVRVVSAIPELRVADCTFNALKIEAEIKNASTQNVSVICFPELSITGYTCADLFYQNKLLQDAETTLLNLMERTKALNIITIVGMPLKYNQELFNVAVVFSKNKILGIVPKLTIPNNNEFYEKRWFQSGIGINETIEIAGQEVPFSANTLFQIGQLSFGIEICEDLWSPIPPSSQLAVEGAKVIFNLSASNELVTKHNYRRQLVEQQSARCRCGYVYSSAGFGESTTDVV